MMIPRPCSRASLPVNWRRRMIRMIEATKIAQGTRPSTIVANQCWRGRQAMRSPSRGWWRGAQRRGAPPGSVDRGGGAAGGGVAARQEPLLVALADDADEPAVEGQ